MVYRSLVVVVALAMIGAPYPTGVERRGRVRPLPRGAPLRVGVFPKDRSQRFEAGSILCAGDKVRGYGEGWITAVTQSPELGHWIGIGFIAGGSEAWAGKSVISSDPVRAGNVEVEVVSPHMVDPEGERLHA